MSAAARFQALCMNDARSIVRETFLLYLIALMFGYALAVRWGLAPLTEWLAPYFDLAPYYAMIVAFLFVLTTPIFMGIIVGFVLLDERDEGTLLAVLVTPMPRHEYLAYRIAVPGVLSVIVTMIAVPLANAAVIPPAQLLPVAMVAALSAPVAMLCFVLIARNKLQGFVLLKLSGSVGLIPVGGWLAPEPWGHLAGFLYPGYWPARAYGSAADGAPGYWWYLAIGVAVHAIFLWFLVRRFQRMASHG